jgi:RNA polymerase sigma-70 factor, ECF subfamily
MTETDREFAERAAKGDREAVAELLRRHLPQLRAWVRLKCGPKLRANESASDIVQSACRDVLENLDHFKFPGDAAFKAWLYKTASRKVADRAEYWGAERRDPARLERYDEQPVETGAGFSPAAMLAVYQSFCSPSQEAAGREEVERIERAFGELVDEQREIILLARIAGLSHKEIAEQLGISEGTARMRLFRALGILAEKLDSPR